MEFGIDCSRNQAKSYSAFFRRLHTIKNNVNWLNRGPADFPPYNRMYYKGRMSVWDMPERVNSFQASEGCSGNIVVGKVRLVTRPPRRI